MHIYREEASPRGETVLRTVGQPTGQSPGMPSIGPEFRLEGLSQLQMLANNSEAGIQSPCEATMFKIAAPSVGTCWQASLLPNTQQCSALYGISCAPGFGSFPLKALQQQDTDIRKNPRLFAQGPGSSFPSAHHDTLQKAMMTVHAQGPGSSCPSAPRTPPWRPCSRSAWRPGATRPPTATTSPPCSATPCGRPGWPEPLPASLETCHEVGNSRTSKSKQRFEVCQQQKTLNPWRQAKVLLLTRNHTTKAENLGDSNARRSEVCGLR